MQVANEVAQLLGIGDVWVQLSNNVLKLKHILMSLLYVSMSIQIIYIVITQCHVCKPYIITSQLASYTAIWKPIDVYLFSYTKFNSLVVVLMHHMTALLFLHTAVQCPHKMEGLTEMCYLH